MGNVLIPVIDLEKGEFGGTRDLFFPTKFPLSVSWSCCVEFLRPGEDAAGSAAWRRTVGRTCDSHAGSWSERDNILISSEMFVPLLV